MTADAATQLRRLLNAIPKLSDGKAHPIDEVARLARTDRDTVLRDLFSLTERLGEPGGFVPGLQVYIGSAQEGVRITNARHFRRPMGLTLAELSALQLGLAMLRAERTPAEYAAIDRARNRLRRIVAKLRAGEWVAAIRHAELGAAGEQSHLSTMRESIQKRRRARIVYRSARSYQFAAGQMPTMVGMCRSLAESATLIRMYALRSKDSRWYTTVKSLAGSPLRCLRIRSSVAVRSYSMR